MSVHTGSARAGEADPEALSSWRRGDLVATLILSLVMGALVAAVANAANNLDDIDLSANGWALLMGVWLLPATLGGLLIRRPGAAILASTIASAIAAVTPGGLSVWGVVLAILVGMAVESVFALGHYVDYRLQTVVAAAGLGGFAAAIISVLHDQLASSFGEIAVYALLCMLSSLGLAGLVAFALFLILRGTGLLRSLRSGH